MVALLSEWGGKLKTSTAELRKLNLQEILWAQIPYEQQQEIDRLAPTHIVVPSGSHIRIDYRQEPRLPSSVSVCRNASE